MFVAAFHPWRCGQHFFGNVLSTSLECVFFFTISAVGHSTCNGSTEGGAVLKCIRDRFNDAVRFTTCRRHSFFSFWGRKFVYACVVFGCSGGRANREFSPSKNFLQLLRWRKLNEQKIFHDEQLVYARVCIKVASYTRFHLKCHIANSSQVKLAVSSNTAWSWNFYSCAWALNLNYTALKNFRHFVRRWK